MQKKPIEISIHGERVEPELIGFSTLAKFFIHMENAILDVARSQGSQVNQFSFMSLTGIRDKCVQGEFKVDENAISGFHSIVDAVLTGDYRSIPNGAYDELEKLSRDLTFQGWSMDMGITGQEAATLNTTLKNRAPAFSSKAESSIIGTINSAHFGRNYIRVNPVGGDRSLTVVVTPEQMLSLRNQTGLESKTKPVFCFVGEVLWDTRDYSLISMGKLLHFDRLPENQNRAIADELSLAVGERARELDISAWLRDLRGTNDGD